MFAGIALKLLGIGKLIPTKVWIGLGILLAIWYYGHWKESQGRQKCEAAVAAAVQKQKQEKEAALQQLAIKLQQEQAEAEREQTTLEAQLREAQNEVDKLETANAVCIPRGVTDKLRRRAR